MKAKNQERLKKYHCERSGSGGAHDVRTPRYQISKGKMSFQNEGYINCGNAQNDLRNIQRNFQKYLEKYKKVNFQNEGHAEGEHKMIQTQQPDSAQKSSKMADLEAVLADVSDAHHDTPHQFHIIYLRQELFFPFLLLTVTLNWCNIFNATQGNANNSCNKCNLRTINKQTNNTEEVPRKQIIHMAI